MLFSQRKPVLVVAEMPNGEQVAISARDESVNMMQCSSTTPMQESKVCEADVEFDDDLTNNEFEIIDRNDGLCHVRFGDGSEAYFGEGLSEDEIMAEKGYFDNLDDELQEEDMKFSLAQIEFLCVYITHMMQPNLEVDELRKLHHNAKIWTVNAAPPFTPVNLRSNHLTKEDLMHLGYHVGTFQRLHGGVIARFVKKVFEKPFERTHVRTIEQKLRESKSTKERIPIHTADQMDKLFAHFQRYGNINPGIMNKK